MKNKIIFLVLSNIFTFTYASFSISWNRDNKLMLSDATTPTTPVIINSNSLYSLFFVENEIDKLFPVSSSSLTTETWSTFLTDTGNNRLVAAAVDATNFGTRTLNITEDQSGVALPQTSGFFYTITFNFDASSLNIDESDPSTWNVSIPNGTYAFISDLTSVSWTADPLATGTPVSVHLGGQWGGGGGAEAGSGITTTQMIPEPGTLALIVMAVGGIVYKLRRRRS